MCRRMHIEHLENDAGDAIGGSTRAIHSDCKEVAGVVPKLSWRSVAATTPKTKS